jgi:hypothetical protein
MVSLKAELNDVIRKDMTRDVIRRMIDLVVSNEYHFFLVNKFTSMRPQHQMLDDILLKRLRNSNV